MKNESNFISLDDAHFFHGKEIKEAGGAGDIRELKELEAAFAAPKATKGGEYLMDVFEMAASYVESICTRHPFPDGNKRTAIACAFTFLYLNGYVVDETYDEELADKILALVTHSIDKKELAEYFRI